MDTTAPEATVAPTESETTAPQQTTEPAQGGNSDSENPKTGNELRQQVIVMLIVVVSAAAAAVTVVIGCKYRKLTR
jgi:heme-binding NEAT domain protein